MDFCLAADKVKILRSKKNRIRWENCAALIWKLDDVNNVSFHVGLLKTRIDFARAICIQTKNVLSPSTTNQICNQTLKLLIAFSRDSVDIDELCSRIRYCVRVGDSYQFISVKVAFFSRLPWISQTYFYVCLCIFHSESRLHYRCIYRTAAKRTSSPIELQMCTNKLKCCFRADVAANVYEKIDSIGCWLYSVRAKCRLKMVLLLQQHKSNEPYKIVHIAWDDYSEVVFFSLNASLFSRLFFPIERELRILLGISQRYAFWRVPRKWYFHRIFSILLSALSFEFRISILILCWQRLKII